MATPRSQLVDPAVTPWYHCISRCVRRAFLCGGQFAHRKQWIVDRLKELVEIFAVDCAGFAIMDNHLHVLLRLDLPRAAAWSDEEVARRWLRLFPIRTVDGQAIPVSEQRVKGVAADPTTIAKLRNRLADLSWFMKCLKEPLARMANKEEHVSGAFWASRFRSVAILDETSLLATAAYIDLNPFAAGIVAFPEASEHTSFRARLDHCRAAGQIETVRDGLSTETHESGDEACGWLLPVEDRRPAEGARAGLIPGLTFSCYCCLIDWTSRLARQGKAHLPDSLASLFDRLHAEAQDWAALVSQLIAGPKPGGSHFGGPDRLSDAARAHGRRWHRNQVPRSLSTKSSAA